MTQLLKGQKVHLLCYLIHLSNIFSYLTYFLGNKWCHYEVSLYIHKGRALFLWCIIELFWFAVIHDWPLFYFTWFMNQLNHIMWIMTTVNLIFVWNVKEANDLECNLIRPLSSPPSYMYLEREREREYWKSWTFKLLLQVKLHFKGTTYTM